MTPPPLPPASITPSFQKLVPSEQILKYSNNYPALLYYKVEWFDFSATNKIDNLTCVIFHDNLMCVDYHEYCIGVYSSIFVGK